MRRPPAAPIAFRSRAARVLGIAYGICALAASGLALADRISDFDAGTSYDNNVGNGKFRSDIHGDLAFAASTSQGLVSQLTDSDSVSAGADLRGQAYTRFSGLDNLSLGGTLGYRKKFGLGAMAPWVSASVSAARLEFQNSDRNGWQYDAGIRAGRRIDERWDVSAEIRVDKRTADRSTALVPGIPGNVFDVLGRSASLATGYAWSSDTLFSASYAFRDGDVVSTTRPNGGIFFASAAVAADPAFGVAEFAYRLHAASQSLALHASQALGGNSSLNLGFQRQFSRGDGGNNYANNLISVNYLYSF